MELKERIINETNGLLKIKSCRLLTMDEIANNLGISKRTLYEQFKDKSSLLENCFNMNFEKAVIDSYKIVETSENSLVSILLMLKKANSSIHTIKYDYIKDLNKYYPEIYQKTFERHINFQKELRNKLLLNALEDNLVLDDINFDLLNSMIQLNLFYCSKNEYMIQNPNHSLIEIAMMHIFIIMRGVSTTKGIEIIDKYKDIFLKK
ncbi:MAG: TetR/AcrR family transcriptional regulator [Bacteroidales bacterium]|nr:TetR/AcrR family transcriptional regulator [Bacteroidales bacterium]